jgi:hypothetical protein
MNDRQFSRPVKVLTNRVNLTLGDTVAIPDVTICFSSAMFVLGNERGSGKLLF